MPPERVTFTGSLNTKLVGLLDRPPDSPPRACAIFAHCFTCSKSYKAPVHVARGLVREGYAVLRFDFTGLGESQGDFADTHFTSNMGDLVAAARYLEETVEAPRILIGHSLGGSAALLAASEIPSAAAVATLAAPYDPAHVAELLGPQRREVEEKGEAEVTIAGRTFLVRREFLESLRQDRLDEKIAGLNRALAIFHSPLDNVVGIEHAARLFEAARHPKSFISLHAADHLLSDERDAQYVGRLIGTWASRFL